MLLQHKDTYIEYDFSHNRIFNRKRQYWKYQFSFSFHEQENNKNLEENSKQTKCDNGEKELIFFKKYCN